MDRRKIILKQVCKYGILSTAVFVLYILQSAPGFLKIFGIKPVFIIPFCLTLSMLDESWQTNIVYILGGLFTDMSSGRTGGFFTIQLIVFCLLGNAMVKYLFKSNRKNSYFFCFTVMVFMLSSEFFVVYVLGGFSHKLLFYIKNVILLSAYSSCFSMLFYNFIDFINLRFLRFDAR